MTTKKVKHAYLIIACGQPAHLQRLIEALDDVRNDIFVHIDKKSDFDFQGLRANYSTLYILPEPLDARWGDVSLVEAELLLIEEMLTHEVYQYCHFLSDSDFPIKSQDYIHMQCDTYHGKEFIGYASAENVKEEISNKVQYYYLFPKDFKNATILQRGVRFLFLRLQHILQIKRNRNIAFKKGCQWCSITYALAEYLFSQRKEIVRMFKHTYCSDEIFIQTMCWNSVFRGHIYRIDDEFGGCFRYIKWKENRIDSIREEDVDKMIASDCWFARKFSQDQEELLDSIKRKWKDA